MTVLANEYDIPDHMRGDTWQGFNSIQLLIDDDPQDVEVARMSLRKKLSNTSMSSTIAMVFTSDEDDEDNLYIDILDSGTIRINEREINVAAGTYNYDVEMTLTSGRIITVLRGEWDIIQDVSE